MGKRPSPASGIGRPPGSRRGWSGSGSPPSNRSR